MGGFLHDVHVADLTLGKRTLFPLPASATVAQAFKALKYSEEKSLSVWVHHDALCNDELDVDVCATHGDRSRCVAVVTMMDIICFLSTDGNWFNLRLALHTPISVLLPSLSPAVTHVDPLTRLDEAMSLMLDGAQHLVMPMAKRGIRVKQMSKLAEKLPVSELPSQDYCWISQEDVVRYLLGSIGVFYPLPMMSLTDLNLIRTEIVMVDRNSPAISAVPLMERVSHQMLAVAVVDELSRSVNLDERPRLLGEISASTMRSCTETSAPALATLAVGEFLSYLNHSGGPPRYLVERVRSKVQQIMVSKLSSNGSLCECPMVAAVPSISPTSSASLVGEDQPSDDSASSDEELSALSTDTLFVEGSFEGSLTKLQRNGSLLKRRSALEPITCRPSSSLVAVMAQALAYRVNYVWVTDEDDGLYGIVTFTDIIDVLHRHMKSLH